MMDGRPQQEQLVPLQTIHYEPFCAGSYCTSNISRWDMKQNSDEHEGSSVPAHPYYRAQGSSLPNEHCGGAPGETSNTLGFNSRGSDLHITGISREEMQERQEQLSSAADVAFTGRHCSSWTRHQGAGRQLGWMSPFTSESIQLQSICWEVKSFHCTVPHRIWALADFDL